MRILYDHFTDVKEWFWKDFKPIEIASRGDGSILVDYQALDKLQLLRELMERPLIINSAYRDPIHNARIGGAPKSSHKEGHAFDISTVGLNKEALIYNARKVGFRGFGLNYNTFLHVDCGRAREW